MPDNCVAFLSYAWCYSSNASPHHLQNTFHPVMPIAHSAGKAPVGLLHCLSCVSSSWRILTASKVSVMIVFFPDVSQGSSSVHCFSNPSYHTLSCGVTSRFFPRNLDGNSSSKVDMIPPPLQHCSYQFKEIKQSNACWILTRWLWWTRQGLPSLCVSV